MYKPNIKFKGVEEFAKEVRGLAEIVSDYAGRFKDPADDVVPIASWHPEGLYEKSLGGVDFSLSYSAITANKKPEISLYTAINGIDGNINLDNKKTGFAEEYDDRCLLIATPLVGPETDGNIEGRIKYHQDVTNFVLGNLYKRISEKDEGLVDLSSDELYETSQAYQAKLEAAD